MNIAKKLDGFKKIAIEEATAEKERKIAITDAEFNKVCAAYKVRIEQKRKKIAEEEMLSLVRQKNKQLQNAVSKGKRDVIALRHKLLDSIACDVKIRLLNYVKSDEYLENLLEEINDVRWDKGATVIYLTRADMNYIRPRITDTSLTFEELDDECIGGYQMRFAGNMLMDNTYKARFADILENISLFQF